jgi:epoxide hydrolase 4
LPFPGGHVTEDYLTADARGVRRENRPPKRIYASGFSESGRTMDKGSDVIWGQRDRYLGDDLAEPDHQDVPSLDRVERLPGASHWVHHDEAERVNQLLIDFFTPAKNWPACT